MFGLGNKSKEIESKLFEQFGNKVKVIPIKECSDVKEAFNDLIGEYHPHDNFELYNLLVSVDRRSYLFQPLKYVAVQAEKIFPSTANTEIAYPATITLNNGNVSWGFVLTDNIIASEGYKSSFEVNLAVLGADDIILKRGETKEALMRRFGLDGIDNMVLESSRNPFRRNGKKEGYYEYLDFPVSIGGVGSLRNALLSHNFKDMARKVSQRQIISAHGHYLTVPSEWDTFLRKEAGIDQIDAHVSIADVSAMGREGALVCIVVLFDKDNKTLDVNTLDLRSLSDSDRSNLFFVANRHTETVSEPFFVGKAAQQVAVLFRVIRERTVQGIPKDLI
jgi:hypothetical protein